MPRRPTSLSRIRLGPEALHGVTVLLRPPQLADFGDWQRIRLRDRRYLEPFWSSSPLDWPARHTGKLWARECLIARAEARSGRQVATVIEVDGRFAGQIELVSIDVGVGQAELGIWIDAEVARHGLGGLAAAMMLDFGFDTLGLDRITAPISPANVAAGRGAEGVGFRREALMVRYFDVGGARRDHELWAATGDAIPPGGFAAHWIRRHRGAGEVRPDRGSDVKAAPADTAKMRSWTVLIATVRYYTGRVLHLFDPLRTPWATRRAAGRRATLSMRVDNPTELAVTIRRRTLGDRTRWRATRLRNRATLDPNPEAPLDCWVRQHTWPRWIHELFCSRAGLRSRRGLVLAIEAAGYYVGECRLFELDMFDRNARMFVWVEPATPQADRIRTAATQLLLDHAFGPLGLCRVATAIEPADHTAAAIAARVGMRHEGTMHHYVGPAGRRTDHDLWARTTPAPD